MRYKVLLSSILTIFLLISLTSCSSSYYPDAEGWDRTILNGDEFESYIPTSVGENLYILSPTEEGLFDEESGPIYVEYREDSEIDFGSNENSQLFEIIDARRTFYAHPEVYDMPVFKMWVETLSADEFPRYKQAILDEVNSYEVYTEKFEYKNHEYYIYLKDFSKLEGVNSIGGTYIFFPEDSASVFLFLFNTRYNDQDSYLISKEEIQKISEQIIDSVLG